MMLNDLADFKMATTISKSYQHFQRALRTARPARVKRSRPRRPRVTVAHKRTQQSMLCPNGLLRSALGVSHPRTARVLTLPIK